jgi:hypothetical protein
MINIYTLAAFWFFSALISTVVANRLKNSRKSRLSDLSVSSLLSTERLLIENKFFLQEHFLEKPVLDEQLPDIGKNVK